MGTKAVETIQTLIMCMVLDVDALRSLNNKMHKDKTYSIALI